MAKKSSAKKTNPKPKDEKNKTEDPPKVDETKEQEREEINYTAGSLDWKKARHNGNARIYRYFKSRNPFRVHNPQHKDEPMRGEIGDYLVMSDDGHRAVVKPDEFEKTLTPIHS